MQALENYRRRLNTLNEINYPAKIRKQADDVLKGAWFRDPETVKATLKVHKPGTYGKEYEVIAEEWVKLIHRAVQENKSASQTDYYIFFYPGTHYPLGTYVDIENIYPDENGEYGYKTWLLTNRTIEDQFTLFNAMECNYLFKFVNKGKIYETLGVSLGMNSYSTGLNTKASMVNVLTDMEQAWIPTDYVSGEFYFDKRVIISEESRRIPFVFRASKVQELHPRGVTKISFIEDKYNPDADYSEKYGRIADINRDIIIDDNNSSSSAVNYTSVIIASIRSKKPNNIGVYEYTAVEDSQLGFGERVKFECVFYDDNGNEITGLDLIWGIELQANEYKDEGTTGNDFNIKLSREYNLGGKKFKVLCKSGDGMYEAEREMQIVVF